MCRVAFQVSVTDGELPTNGFRVSRRVPVGIRKNPKTPRRFMELLWSFCGSYSTSRRRLGLS